MVTLCLHHINMVTGRLLQLDHHITMDTCGPPPLVSSSPERRSVPNIGSAMLAINIHMGWPRIGGPSHMGPSTFMRATPTLKEQCVDSSGIQRNRLGRNGI
ncbi:unnamed protein product [Boreogadus saida]